MDYSLDKSSERKWKNFEKELPNIRRWNKAVAANLTAMAVKEDLKEVIGYLEALREKIGNGVMEIEEGEKEIERLENDLKEDGDLHRHIVVRGVYYGATFEKEYLKRGGKMSWPYWFSMEFIVYIKNWWMKYILGKSMGEITLKGRNRRMKQKTRFYNS